MNCLSLGLVGLLTLPGLCQDYPLNQKLDAEVALTPKIHVHLRIESGHLEIRNATSRQEVPLDTLIPGSDSPGQGSIKVQDFDFDGIRDLAIPVAEGYGGVNMVYAVYRWQGPNQKLQPIQFEGSDWNIVNPKLHPKSKHVTTDSRSGPLWYGTDYVMKNKQPVLWQNRQPVLLDWLLKSPEVAMLIERPTPDKQFQPICLVDGEGPVKGVSLHSLGLLSQAGSTHVAATLPAGSSVVLNRVQSHHQKLYVQVHSGSKSGWLLLPPEALKP